MRILWNGEIHWVASMDIPSGARISYPVSVKCSHLINPVSVTPLRSSRPFFRTNLSNPGDNIGLSHDRQIALEVPCCAGV